MRTLVTGANGQLGKSIKNLVIQQQISDSFVFATRDQLNLSDLKSLKRYFETHTFNLIINCAAYTAVDRAELDEKEANMVNHLAVKQIAEIAQNKNIIELNFIQKFNSDKYSDTGIKELLWIKGGGDWKILKETWISS